MKSANAIGRVLKRGSPLSAGHGGNSPVGTTAPGASVAAWACDAEGGAASLAAWVCDAAGGAVGEAQGESISSAMVQKLDLNLAVHVLSP